MMRVCLMDVVFPCRAGEPVRRRPEVGRWLESRTDDARPKVHVSRKGDASRREKPVVCTALLDAHSGVAGRRGRHSNTDANHSSFKITSGSVACIRTALQDRTIPLASASKSMGFWCGRAWKSSKLASRTRTPDVLITRIATTIVTTPTLDSTPNPIHLFAINVQCGYRSLHPPNDRAQVRPPGSAADLERGCSDLARSESSMLPSPGVKPVGGPPGPPPDPPHACWT